MTIRCQCLMGLTAVGHLGKIPLMIVWDPDSRKAICNLEGNFHSVGD